MDEIAKSITDIVTKDMPTSRPRRRPNRYRRRRCYVHRRRVNVSVDASPNWRALVAGYLNTLIKTLGLDQERL